MMSHSPGDSADDAHADSKRGGKRELSTSKRAAQNRAAQVSSVISLYCFHLGKPTKFTMILPVMSRQSKADRVRR